MSFDVVSVTAETDCSLTVPLSVTAVNGKTTFGRSLVENRDFFHAPLYSAPPLGGSVGILPSRLVWKQEVKVI